MKQSDIIISEVKLIYRTNVKASERFQDSLWTSLIFQKPQEEACE